MHDKITIAGVLFFCALVCALSASVLVWLYLMTVYNAKRHKTWPCVDGSIIKVKINCISDDGIQDQYTFELVYEYTVNNVNYTRNKLSACSMKRYFDSHEAVSRYLNNNNYREGSSVPVYFNPSSHWDAVLIKGKSPEYYECLQDYKSRIILSIFGFFLFSIMAVLFT
ncbi:MAG: DUF3592 domain-containing protein [Gammaproteobacteria bacterium]|nr:DUF3592 domain-containing protein [Gammaproteobacteria bacterium]